MKLYGPGLLLALLGILGCTASQAHAPGAGTNPHRHIEASYAAGLQEAFEVYADEVYTAALIDYTSVAEAEAVVRTLSDQHFDQLLANALARRGLTKQGLSRFAEEHAAFFHQQQRLHWGKLQRLEATLSSLPLRVRPAPADDSLAALEGF